MTNQEIFELIDRFERSSICMMRLSAGGVSLELSKDGAALPAAMLTPVAQTAQIAPAPDAQAAKPAAVSTITAPLAGVFYAACAPGAKPYVAVGDMVKEGDTVCLMEAMKMISEIPAPCDCIITQVLKENGVLASFGEPLFSFKPC